MPASLPPIPTDAVAFREFVRTHHPDRGGDPEVFAAVVSAYRARPGSAGGVPVVVEPTSRLRLQVRRGLRRAQVLPGQVRRGLRRRAPRVD